MREPLNPPGLITSCAIILFAAVVFGAVFNLVMPQGIGLTPPWISDPLWKPASPQEAAQLKKQGALLVDARDSNDYKLERVRGALNLSPSEFGLLYPLLKPVLNQAPAVVIYGRYTSRFPAAHTGQLLKKQGAKEVYVVKGSMADLRTAGLELQRPRRRQGS